MDRTLIPRHPSAVIFDLDGTLVDSAPDLAAAIGRMLTAIGRAPLSLPAVRGMVGEGVTVLVERALAATGDRPGEADFAALLERFRADYEARVADHSQLYPGATATLGRLKAAGVKIGLCTNKPGGPTRALLRALAADHWFDAVITGDGPYRKPDPRPVREAVAALGESATRVVYVGDSATDLAAARGAGLAVILVTFGYTTVPARTLGADAIIDRLIDLPPLLGLAPA